MKEEFVQQRVRLQLGEYGLPAWRNNVGACYDDTGRLIRYGLGNDTKELNEVLKSPDVISIQPIVITPDMVGRTIGRMVGIECKSSDWHLTPGDKRAQAQKNFHDVIRRYGGVAGFATSVDDVERILRGW